jgi:hypothetical protein
MASGRPNPQENALRGPHEGFADHTDNEAATVTHPTLSQIAHRQLEIEDWEARNVGGYQFAKPGAVLGFLVTAVLMFLAITPIPPNWPWNIPLVIAATFTAVGTVVCGLLWFEHPDIGPRPEPLQIVPFCRTENLDLMARQLIQPYQARCACPGCGEECTHLVRTPADGDPSWATVTRRCATCEREWAQA